MDTEEFIIRLLATPIKLQKIKIKGYTINFIVAGKGKPLLLIHGLNIGLGQWYPNISELSKNFTVYALDLPGSGNSSDIDYKHTSDLIQAFVEVVEEFVRKMSIKSISVIGHSIGGAVAAKIAYRRKVSVEKLILTNSLGFIPDIPLSQIAVTIYPLAKLLSTTVMRPNRANIKKFIQSVIYNPKKINNDFVDYYHRNIINGKNRHPFLLMNKLSYKFKLRNEILIQSELAQLKMPTLIIFGDKDTIVPYSKVIKALANQPNISIELIKDVGHVPSIEKSHKFNQLVIHFIRL